MNTEREAFLLRKARRKKGKVEEREWGEDGMRKQGKISKKQRECVRSDSRERDGGGGAQGGKDHSILPTAAPPITQTMR